MFERGWNVFTGRRVLLLQGPVGPFFAQFARRLRSVGAASVDKVNFNGGDWLFYPAGSAYRGTLEDWPAQLEALIAARGIDTVVLFGDCRPIHRATHALTARLGIQVWVFEEGYVRPNYVTLERTGVNNRSLLPRRAEFYLDSPVPPPDVERQIHNPVWHAALWAVLYYAAAILLRPLFPRYRHHRPLAAGEALPWLRSPLRKLKYRLLERGMQRRLSTALSKQFFLVPLQVNTDAQIKFHSSFRGVPEFLEAVIASFAAHAPARQHLVFKHHPMDRGYHDYGRLIDALAARHGLSDRVQYIHDQHLPTLLAHARGVVVINSTVGLSALHHGTPLKVLGNALYDLPGLTAQQPLDAFWQQCEQEAPDARLFFAFRNHLIRRTQLNGNFYRHGLFPVPAAQRAQPALPVAGAAFDAPPAE